MIDDSRTAELDGVAASPVPDTVALHARSYTSELIEDRTVVRLVRDELLDVEDLTMAAFGFEQSDDAPVGHTRKRAIGFPAWPIIQDPDNAQHALNLVQDLQRVAKLAKNRPGPAKDRLIELGDILGRSAPHFVPTFYEEAARIFLANENRNYAVQFFGRAREAERVHNLALDEDRHAAVLLEFALAGGLSAKELSNESKALLDRLAAEEALARFTSLLLEQARGGVSPYSGMHTDVRRLIKAAGADGASIEAELLTTLLDSPTIKRAPAGFWKGFAAPVKQLAKDPEIRAKLLWLFPEHLTIEDWIDVLAKLDLLSDLTSGTEPDVAGWLTRALDHGWETSANLVDLIRECTLTGATVTIARKYSRSVDARVVEAILAVGGEVDNHRSLDLDQWAFDGAPHDFPEIAKRPTLWDGLVRAAGHMRRNLDSLLQYPHTTAALKSWATSRLGPDPSRLEVESEWRRVSDLCTEELLPTLADELGALRAALDPAAVIAASLRPGLATELTWPELEAAERRVHQVPVAEAPQDDDLIETDDPVTLHESWPAIGVAHDGRVEFVDGDEVVAAAEFTVAAGNDSSRWTYVLVDGVIGCSFRSGSIWGPEEVVWSNDPATSHTVEYSYRRTLSLPVPGGRLCGSHLQRPNTDLDMSQSAILSDGSSYWARDPKVPDTWVEVDPDSGRTGRASLPTALADLVAEDLREGFVLDQDTLWHPVTPTTADSLLPTANGIHGWVQLIKAGETRRQVGVDGTRTEGHGRDAVIRRPGGGLWFRVDSWRGDMIDGDGNELERAKAPDGERHLLTKLPLVGWHQLRVRDEAASARLRTLSAEDVATLAEVAPTDDLEEKPWSEAAGRANDAAVDLLGTTDRALVDAVRWVATDTKDLLAEIDKALGMAPPTGSDGPAALVSHLDITEVLTGRDYADRSFATVVAALGEAMRTGTAAPASVAAEGPAGLALAATIPEVVLALALQPFHPTGDAAAACQAIIEVCEAGLYTPSTVAYDWDWGGTEVGSVISVGGGWSVVYGLGSRHRVAALSSTGVPDSVDNRPTRVLSQSGGVEVEQILDTARQALAQCEQPGDHGAGRWRPESAQKFAELSGWSLPAAKILYGGLHEFKKSIDDAFDPERAAVLELTEEEVRHACAFLEMVGAPALTHLICIGSQNLDTLVTDGLDPTDMATAWRDSPLSDIPLSDAELYRFQSEQGLHRLTDLRELARGKHGYGQDSVLLSLVHEAELTPAVGAWVADRFDDLREDAADSVYEWTEYEPFSARKGLGLPLSGAVEETRGAWSLHTISANWADYDRVTFTTANVTDWDHEVQLMAAMPDPPRGVLAAGLLVTGAYDSLVADLRSGKVEGFAADPLRSAPEVVAEVMTELELPEDAARYWLQLLALPNPTDKNLKLWNGWQKKQRVQAAEPLLAQELIVEAKRSRAGRSYFLPGGWQEASSPHLPLEVWKAPQLALADEAKVTPAVHHRVFVLTGYRQQFRDAWDRYRSGDRPGYTELRTERYRRR